MLRIFPFDFLLLMRGRLCSNRSKAQNVCLSGRAKFSGISIQLVLTLLFLHIVTGSQFCSYGYFGKPVERKYPILFPTGWSRCRYPGLKFMTSQSGQTHLVKAMMRRVAKNLVWVKWADSNSDFYILFFLIRWTTLPLRSFEYLSEKRKSWPVKDTIFLGSQVSAWLATLFCK